MILKEALMVLIVNPLILVLAIPLLPLLLLASGVVGFICNARDRQARKEWNEAPYAGPMKRRGCV